MNLYKWVRFGEEIADGLICNRVPGQFVLADTNDIRAGVESGTIEGEVKVARNRLAGWNPVMEVEQTGTYLVIPVSDGGSET